MTHKFLLPGFLIILILIAVGFYTLYSNREKPFSTMGGKNPTNQVDVLALKQNDYNYISKNENNTVFLTKNNSQKQVHYKNKPLMSLALSPSQEQVAFYYFPDRQSSEELNFTLLNLESHTTTPIYSALMSSLGGSMRWLGNNHLIFLRHCGTACQGIILLNVKSGQTTDAVLSYPPFPDMPEETHFRDWFGQEFTIDGLVRNINSETKDDLHYLIFETEDYEGNALGEKQFRFTGTEVIEL